MSIQAVRGTKDILPDTIGQWQFIEDIFRNVSSKYCYEELRTPIFEKTEVFSRSIGDATDIVNKEMYTFSDKGGESITLRPEMTAALVRAVIQYSLHTQSQQLRYWYFGPFFRYERPQKGRLRQFHQYGAECINSPYPESDVEIIMLADDIIKSAGVKEYRLLLNTLGSKETRSRYREELVKYFSSLKDTLSEDSKYRLDQNPLRILDSKDERDAEAVKNAPVILDFLDPESEEHFETVKRQLTGSGIDVIIQPRLVRGLDYYSHTVFEFQSSALGAQDSLGGGGRYNHLFEQLGGKQTPAVGFALGVERLLLILGQIEALPQIDNAPDVFVITQNKDQMNYSINVINILRERGLKVCTDLQRRSVKAQMREANRLNSRYTVMIGENEVVLNDVLIKNMSNGEQLEVPLYKLGEYSFK